MTAMDIPGQQKTIYTIGHSNHSLEAFLNMLAAHGIEVLVDTRSQPYSKFAPHFNANGLRAAVTTRGIGYEFYGRELGGRPDARDLYDDDGHVLYGKVAESPLFRDGIARLTAAMATRRMALLCSEENPSVCHRSLLVGRVLAEHGVAVRHIRANGIVQCEEVIAAERRQATAQLDLFGESEEPQWRSLQSVLHKRMPQLSSER
jgi:uncharacterized protein (DUF488 family)